MWMMKMMSLKTRTSRRTQTHLLFASRHLGPKSCGRYELYLTTSYMKHVGYEDFHGGKGFGRRNEEGERMLEIAEASNLMFINTLIMKRRSI